MPKKVGEVTPLRRSTRGRPQLQEPKEEVKAEPSLIGKRQRKQKEDVGVDQSEAKHVVKASEKPKKSIKSDQKQEANNQKMRTKSENLKPIVDALKEESQPI